MSQTILTSDKLEHSTAAGLFYFYYTCSRQHRLWIFVLYILVDWMDLSLSHPFSSDCQHQDILPHWPSSNQWHIHRYFLWSPILSLDGIFICSILWTIMWRWNQSWYQEVDINYASLFILPVHFFSLFAVWYSVWDHLNKYFLKKYLQIKFLHLRHYLVLFFKLNIQTIFQF